MVDPATGMITREWYRFLFNLFNLTGAGQSDLTVQDLMSAPVSSSAPIVSDVGLTPASVQADQGAVQVQSQLYSWAAQNETRLSNLEANLGLQPPVIPAMPETTFGTVTHTTGALTLNKFVVGNGGDDERTLTDVTWSSGGVTFVNPVTAPSFVGAVSSVDGSYTGTGTGFTTSPTATVTYSKVGNLVVLNLPTITGTSNQTYLTLTGGPAGMRPANSKSVLAGVQDNGVLKLGTAIITTSGEIVFYSDIAGSSFTASGSKGFAGNSICYTLV